MKVTRDKSDGVRRKKEKRQKMKTVFSVCFAASFKRGISIPSSESNTTQFLPHKLDAVCKNQATQF